MMMMMMTLMIAQRLKMCKDLIEKDDRGREFAHLPVPSLLELRAAHGVKVIKGDARRELLKCLGVIERAKPTSSTSSKSIVIPKLMSLDNTLSNDRKRK